MSIIRSVLTFFMIVGFAGAVVLVAARDMRRTLGKHSEDQKFHAQELLKTLRGDALLEKSDRYYVNPQSLPQRSAGSVLPATDKQRMKDFLRKLIGFTADSPESDDKKK